MPSRQAIRVLRPVTKPEQEPWRQPDCAGHGRLLCGGCDLPPL